MRLRLSDSRGERPIELGMQKLGQMPVKRRGRIEGTLSLRETEPRTGQRNWPEELFIMTKISNTMSTQKS